MIYPFTDSDLISLDALCRTYGEEVNDLKTLENRRGESSEFHDADEPANPSSERLVVRNKTEQKREDLIKPPSSVYEKNKLNASCSV